MPELACAVQIDTTHHRSESRVSHGIQRFALSFNRTALENNGASAIARSRLSKLTAVLDLGVWGLPEHGLIFGHARVDTDQAILANTDIVVNSLIYRAKLANGWSSRVAIEARNSGNKRYDNEFVAMSLRYDF